MHKTVYSKITRVKMDQVTETKCNLTVVLVPCNKVLCSWCFFNFFFFFSFRIFVFFPSCVFLSSFTCYITCFIYSVGR